MVVIRATRKLLPKLNKLKRPTLEMPISTNRLGDWYANPIRIDGRPVVLFASERTLLPLLVDAAPTKLLPARLLAETAIVLRALGVEEEAIQAELDEMHAVAFMPTANRRVLGSMNDLALAARDQYGPLLDIALDLAKTPCSPIGMESPDRLTVALFANAGQ
jgi:hypothetical protein